MVDVSKPLWRLYKKFGEKHKTGQLSRAGQQQGDRGLVLATATNISWHGRVEESDNLNYNPMYSKNTAASAHSPVLREYPNNSVNNMKTFLTLQATI